jgi:benzodiazapine receptor
VELWLRLRFFRFCLAWGFKKDSRYLLLARAVWGRACVAPLPKTSFILKKMNSTNHNPIIHPSSHLLARKSQSCTSSLQQPNITIMTNDKAQSSTPPSTPSPLSPVGNNGGHYLVTIDDEELDISPVPTHNMPDNRSGGDSDNDDYFNDHPPPRLSMDDDLLRPLLHSHLEPAKLNGLNLINVIAFLVNAFVSYGIGVWGLGGLLPTRWEISKENETLITPAEWAYFLWAPILAAEAIFAIAQLFPHYRARPIIQQGTGFFFLYTCLLQTAWTLFFAFRLFILSFVAVVGALISLASLLASQYYSQVRGRRSLVEYWLFKFPFYLHCGWLILCSVLQFSLLFLQSTGNPGVQLAADIVALGIMLPAATYFLTGQPSGPDFVIPLVIVWNYVRFILYIIQQCVCVCVV